jgi:hypothetical protein
MSEVLIEGWLVGEQCPHSGGIKCGFMLVEKHVKQSHVVAKSVRVFSGINQLGTQPLNLNRNTT